VALTYHPNHLAKRRNEREEERNRESLYTHPLKKYTPPEK